MVAPLTLLGLFFHHNPELGMLTHEAFVTVSAVNREIWWEVSSCSAQPQALYGEKRTTLTVLMLGWDTWLVGWLRGESNVLLGTTPNPP